MNILKSIWHYIVIALLLIAGVFAYLFERSKRVRLELEIRKREYEQEMKKVQDQIDIEKKKVVTEDLQLMKLDFELDNLSKKRDTVIKGIEELKLGEDPEEVSKRIREL